MRLGAMASWISRIGRLASNSPRARIQLAYMLVIAGACASTAPAAKPNTTNGVEQTGSATADLPAAVKLELEQRVREAEGDGAYPVTVTLNNLPSAHRVLLVAANLHGTGIQLLQLEIMADGTGMCAVVHAPDVGAAALTADPPKLEVLERVVQPDLTHRLLARATLALGAEIQILAPETDEVVLRQLNTVHDTESIGVRAWTAAGAGIERRFDGQPGNMTEPQRAPLDSIRGDLTSLLPTTPPSLGRAPSARHQNMLVDAWPQINAVPTWTYARLLALAAALPSAPLTRLLEPTLEGTEELSIRTIEALAATTQTDLRRDASGQLRALPEIVQAYRQLLQSRSLAKP